MGRKQKREDFCRGLKKSEGFDLGVVPPFLIFFAFPRVRNSYVCHYNT